MRDKRDKQRLYRAEGIKLLYSNALPGILITFIVATSLVFTFLDHDNRTGKLIWWAIICLLLAVRLVDTLLWYRANSFARKQNHFYWRFSTGCLLTALLWSGWCLFFSGGFSIEEFTSSMVILSAMAGGATSILSGNALIGTLYPIIVLVPFSLELLCASEKYKNNLGALGLCFTAIMVFSAGRAARYVKSAILLKYKNSQLLERMEETIRTRTQEIYEISHTDSLTGLHNRVAFLRAANALTLRYKQNEISGFSLFFIDLDGFKAINDTLGHDAGDQILLAFSDRLKTFNRDNNAMLCRWGGDEFIFCIPLTDRAQLARLAQEMNESFSQPWALRGQELFLSATIGIAICPRHSEAITRLIQLADIAMYSLKGKQPQRVAFYNRELETELLNQVYLQEALKSALAKNEMRLVYQPIVEAQSGRIVSLETLLRWQCGDDAIPPSLFIPVAEKSGSIVPLGYWIIEEACKTLAELPPAAKEIALSVNVSIVQLQDAAFIDKVEQLLTHYAIAPERLHLEVTESLFHESQTEIYAKVSYLQDKGVRISIDDFGTGYSSLSVIQNMRIDFVKIDRSFVNNIDDKGLAVVQAVLTMSGTFGYEVIAEGVETARQAQTLRNFGVPLLQGYYFSQPLEKAAMLARVFEATCATRL